MTPAVRLVIRLTPGLLRPRVGDVRINDVCGGPETLPRWLEIQLGLPSPPVHIANRITEYATALDMVTHGAITASLQTDRWATASALPSRRDELLLAGWDGGDRETLPDVVRDLAHAAAGRDFVFPCEADRLHQILRALDAVQVFPRTSACCTMRGVTDALHRLKTKAGNAAVQINGVSKPVFAFNTARNQLTRCYFVELTAEMKAGASNEIEVTVPVIAGLTFGGAYLDLPDQMPLGEVDK